MRKKALLLFLTFILAGCSAPLSPKTSEILNAPNSETVIETRDAITQIEDQIESYQSEVEIKGYTCDEATAAFEECKKSHPEYFWLKDSYSYMYSERENLTIIRLSYAYDVDKIPAMRKFFDAVVEGVVSQANALSGDFEKARFVHDYIVKKTTYSETDYDIALADSEAFCEGSTAYGCLVNHVAICGGYTKSYMYILGKCGVECLSVTGLNVEDDTPHIWNLVKMDGDYYHIDVTWDDPITLDGSDTVSYDFFGITTEEALLTHTIDEGQDVPSCTSMKDNYHVHEGYYLEKYNYSECRDILQKQLQTSDRASIRFGSISEADVAQGDLIDNQRIFDILGNNNASYVKSNYIFSVYK